MNESRPPRTNRWGHPCPPWCATDHSVPVAQSHWGTATFIEVLGTGRTPDRIVSASHLASERDKPEVSVTTVRHGSEPPWLWLSPAVAGHLAGIVEMLAGATPDQHRELAEAIRKAAAGITGVGDD